MVTLSRPYFEPTRTSEKKTLLFKPTAAFGVVAVLAISHIR